MLLELYRKAPNATETTWQNMHIIPKEVKQNAVLTKLYKDGNAKIRQQLRKVYMAPRHKAPDDRTTASDRHRVYINKQEEGGGGVLYAACGMRHQNPKGYIAIRFFISTKTIDNR